MNKAELDLMTKTELLDLARSLDVKGRSLMSKKALVNAVEAAQNLSTTKKDLPKSIAAAGVKKVAKVVKSSKPANRLPQTNAKKLLAPVPKAAALVEKKDAPNPIVPSSPEYCWHLPQNYGTNRLVLMGVDPTHAYAYWELQSTVLDQVRDGKHGDLVLRIYDITDLKFDGHNAWGFDDHHVGYSIAWYMHTGTAGRSLVAELGWLSEGVFKPVLRSNTVRLPLDRPSQHTDQQWMIVSEDFDRIYALSGGMPFAMWEKAGASAGLRDVMAQRMRLNLSSEASRLMSATYA